MSEWITGKTPPPDQKPDKFEEAARKAVELTDLCKLHMEYHGQQTPDCTPEKRVLITFKPDTTLRDEIDQILKREQEYVQQCTLANIEAAKTTGQWIIHDPSRQATLTEILDLLAKILPEEKDSHIHHMTIWEEGYNQALSEVRAIVDGVDHV